MGAEAPARAGRSEGCAGLPLGRLATHRLRRRIRDEVGVGRGKREKVT